MTGFYTDCINPFHNPVAHGFYSNGQIYAASKICPVCWYRAGFKEIVTVPGPIKKTRIDSKPEKESL